MDVSSICLLAARQGPGAAEAAAGAIGAMIFMLIYLALIILMIAGMWKVFAKAGKPGWAAIIPFYNVFVLVEISGKDIVWFIMFFIPCANIIAAFVVYMEVAKAFGKDPAYGIGMVFLPFIFFPMLGFGSAQYQGTPQA